MIKKTMAELECEIRTSEVVDMQRKVSNELYAIKLVEKIVFGMVTLILVGIMGAIIALVLK